MFNPRRILYVQYANPGAYPPLEHSSRILANAGWEVLFLGTGLAAVNALRFPPHERIHVQWMKYSPPGWYQKLHYLFYMAWVLKQVGRWRPQYIYASDIWGCPIAWLLSFVPGLRIIYHEHDSPGTPDSVFQQLCMVLRRRLARRAEVCVLPNQFRAESFAQQTGRSNVICVWNCPRRDEIGEARPAASSGELRMIYHGSVVPHRLPVTVLAAMARLPEPIRLLVVGYETAGHTGYLGHLRRESERLGISDRLEIREAVPRYELMRMCRSCDIGLALTPSASADINFQGMIGASNKAFDYLAHGCALLVTDHPDWQQLYVEPRYGLACDPADPQSIAQALRWFQENREEARAMGEGGRQRVAREWNYETQFDPVWQCLKGWKEPCRNGRGCPV